MNLTVSVVGGEPPFTYSWSSNPLGQIPANQTTVTNPVVNPTNNTTYTVVVTDDFGNTASSDASVDVELEVFVNDPPPPLQPGESTQLNAVAIGGDGAYTYRWQPAATLSDATIADPIATPDGTTTYSVTANDGTGALATAEVLVEVEGDLPPLAACIVITPSDPTTDDVVRFDASCSTGNISYYRWWVDNLDDPAQEGPDSFIEWQFDLPGLYYIKLEVTERGTGETAEAFTAVDVR